MAPTPADAALLARVGAARAVDRLSLRPDDRGLPRNRETEFKLFVFDISYFSGKLEMYFRYKELDFERMEMTGKDFADISVRTGMQQIPLVYDARTATPDAQRWLRDTTPIILHVERDAALKAGRKSVLPECAVQRFFCMLVEDFADEMLWRPAMYYRWEPSHDGHVLSTRFTYEFARETPAGRLPRAVVQPALEFRQWLFSVEGEDLVTDDRKAAVEQQYLDLLAALEPVLDKQPYLLGDWPTIADFGLSGPLFRHFGSDPTPKKIMQQRAPAVWLWLARMWHARQSRLPAAAAFPSPGELPEAWGPLLSQVRDYLDYSAQNAAAHAAGRASFDFAQHGIVFRAVPVVPYRVWCRAQLRAAFLAIPDPAETARCGALLREHGLWEPLWSGPDVGAAAPEGGCAPPFCRASTAQAMAKGSPKWDMDRLVVNYLRSRAPRAARTAAAIAAAVLLAERWAPRAFRAVARAAVAALLLKLVRRV